MFKRGRRIPSVKTSTTIKDAAASIVTIVNPHIFALPVDQGAMVGHSARSELFALRSQRATVCAGQIVLCAIASCFAMEIILSLTPLVACTLRVLEKRMSRWIPVVRE